VKGLTKTIAAFCAMAMIFSAFSASVFAEENEPQAEQTVEAAEENGSEKQDDDQDKDQNLNDNQNEDQGSNTDGSVSDDANKDADGETDADTTSEDGQGAPADVNGTDDTATTEPEDPTVGGSEVPANAESTKKMLSGTRSGGIVEVDQTWIDDVNGEVLPNTPGSYKLVGDISVNKTTETTEAGTITIDLNGYKITYTGTTSMYIIGKIRGANNDGKGKYSAEKSVMGVELVIKDSGSTGEITASKTTNGSNDYWMNNTSVGVDPNRGGCFLIQNGSKLTFMSGKISNFHAKDEGGAICASNGSEFVMEGGTITNCSAGQGGAAISSHGSSKGLYYTQDGYHISIKATVTITGGTIVNNTSTTRGGAIRINRSDFYLSNATITGNKVTNSGGAANSVGGGGVSIEFNEHGQTIEFSGSPVIKNNTDNEADKANLYLVNEGIVIDASNLSLNAEITFGAKNNATDVAYFTGVSSALESCFAYNSADFVPYYDNGSIKIKEFSEPEAPEIAGYSLVVGGDIRLRAALKLGNFDESGTSVTYAYSYTKGSNTVNVEKTVNYSNFGTSGSYKTVDIPVESACITSPITVTINYGSGEQASDDPVTIDRYISAIMNGNYTDKVKAVAYSLRTFGSFAMMQFNINMNDPALRPANEEINASLYDPQTVIYNKYLIGEGAAYTPANDPDGAFYGASVNFLSKTEVNMYFKKSVLGATAPTMTVTYSDSSTETISATENGSYYVYTVKGPSGDGFAATLFDVPFSFSVGTTSGEYSINTYLQLIEYKYHGDTNNILLKLVEAYYDFARKCQQL